MIACAETSTLAPSEKGDKEKNGTFVIGNGADGIQCDSGYQLLGGQNFGFLDFFEMQKRGLEIRSFEESNPFSIAKKIIEKLKSVDRVRYEIYSNYLDEFDSETLYLTNAHLPEIPDNGPLELPGSDCKLVQLVQQLPEKLLLSQKGRSSGKGRYNIDESHWKKLNPLHQAGVIIHEIVYREVLEYGITTSPRIRYFTGELFSKKFESINHETYTSLIDEIRFPGVLKIAGELYRTSQTLYGENGYVKYGFLTANDASNEKNPKIKIFGSEYLLSRQVIERQGTNIILHLKKQDRSDQEHSLQFIKGVSRQCSGYLNQDTIVTFSDSGVVLKLVAESDRYVEILPSFVGQDFVPVCHSELGVVMFAKSIRQKSAVEFHETGVVKEAQIESLFDRTESCRQSVCLCDISQKSTSKFYANGQITTANICQRSKLGYLTQHGDTIPLLRGDSVTFTEDGEVMSDREPNEIILPNLEGKRENSYYYDDDGVFHIKLRHQKNTKKMIDSYAASDLKVNGTDRFFVYESARQGIKMICSASSSAKNSPQQDNLITLDKEFDIDDKFRGKIIYACDLELSALYDSQLTTNLLMKNTSDFLTLSYQTEQLDEDSLVWKSADEFLEMWQWSNIDCDGNVVVSKSTKYLSVGELCFISREFKHTGQVRIEIRVPQDAIDR